ncbi:MAG: hypothetical protein E7004_01690 [Alphaproteobacteria bacterium]|nr:hypothetical protein [Alphaproteobacteria bacterium]
MSKWDDYSISEEEWKYLKKVTGEDIDNYNGYRMEVFLLTNKGILETYRNPKKVETSTENKENIPSQDSKEDQTKKSMEELKKELEVKKAELKAYYKKNHEENDVIDSEEFKNWKDEYIKNNPNDTKFQELVKEIERIKTAIDALEGHQSQVQATQQAQDKKADTKVKTLEEKIEYAENVLIGYLGMRYEEEHPDENVNQGTWESDAYKQWVENYGKTHPNDEDYKKYVTEFEKLKAEKQAQATQADTKANATTQAQAVTGGDIPVISGSTSEQSEKTDKQSSDTMVVNEASDEAGTLNVNEDDAENRIPTEELKSVYTSDEWNQILTIASKTAVHTAAQIDEGIVFAALKEVLDENTPKNWDSMTLDEQEKFIKQLSPEQMSKFNDKVTELSKKIAETLPPEYLVMTVESIDKSLESKDIKDEERKSLEEQRKIIIDTMCNVISQVPENVTFDPENAAGAYDGFMSMINYLTSDKNKNIEIDNKKVEQIKQAFEVALKEYDDMNGLSGIDEKSSEELLKTYNYIEKKAKQQKFEDLLDDETKEIFNLLEFPDTTDEKGNQTSSENNKQLFIEAIVNKAIQKASVANCGKSKEELEKAFKEELLETTLSETINLIASQEVVDQAQGKGFTLDPKADVKDTKEQIKAYISTAYPNKKKIKISQKALTGYFAYTVNKQSLFVNRLANKLKDRSAVILQKMWKPFQKIDRTCINRFGQAYTLAKSIVKNQVKNLPWTLGMAATRIAAFSLAATPYGWAAVAGYGLISVGVTTYRMIKNYKELKKENPNYSKKEFFKQNWSGMVLSAIGTAASVIPGLGASVEGLQGAVDFMKTTGMLSQTGIPVASQLGMTNVSVAMVGAGWADSTIRGTAAQRKRGESFGRSLLFAATSSTLNTAASIGMSVGCSQACNAAFNSGMNLIGDTRTIDSSEGNMERDVTPVEFNQKIEELGLSDELKSLQNGNLTQEEYNQTLEKISDTLKENGLILKNTEDEAKADVTIKWSETRTVATEEAINNSKETVEYWTSADPKVYAANIETLEQVVAEYNAKHPEAPLDAHRAYHTILLMGAQTVSADIDTLQNHVNGGGSVDCKGLHTAMTDSHFAKHPDWGISAENAQAVRNVADSQGYMNSDALKAVIETVAAAEKHVSTYGEVGQNDSTRSGAHTDGVLDRNATIDPNTGEHVRAEEGKGTIFDTYVDGKDAHQTITEEKKANFQVVQKQDNIYMPVNHEPMLFAGVRKFWAKIMGNNLAFKKEQEKAAEQTPPNNTPVENTTDQTTKDSTPVENTTNQTAEDSTQEENTTDDQIKKWLIEEYKIIHGIEPNEAQYVKYKKLVQEEHNAELEKGITDKPFSKEYFEDRMAQFNHSVEASIKESGDSPSKRIGKRRTDMWSLKAMTKSGKPLEVMNVTLRDFEHIATISDSGEEHAALTAARDTSKIPLPEGKKDKPHGGTFDIITKKTKSGDTTNNGQGVNDGLPSTQTPANGLKCSGKGCGPSRHLER